MESVRNTTLFNIHTSCFSTDLAVFYANIHRLRDALDITVHGPDPLTQALKLMFQSYRGTASRDKPVTADFGEFQRLIMRGLVADSTLSKYGAVELFWRIYSGSLVRYANYITSQCKPENLRQCSKANIDTWDKIYASVGRSVNLFAIYPQAMMVPEEAYNKAITRIRELEAKLGVKKAKQDEELASTKMENQKSSMEFSFAIDE